MSGRRSGTPGSGDPTRVIETRWPVSRWSSAELPRLSWAQQLPPRANSMSALHLVAQVGDPCHRALEPSGCGLPLFEVVEDQVMGADLLAVESRGRAVVHVRRAAHLLQAAVIDDGQA